MVKEQIEIAKFEKEQDDYKNKKHSDIPKIKRRISELVEEKKRMTITYDEVLKEYASFAKKDKKFKENYKPVKEHINELEQKIELKEQEIQYEYNEIYAIEKSKEQEISELKNKLFDSKNAKK